MTTLTFCSYILTIAIRVPMSVTSWGRSEKRNKAVGGAAQSRHLIWQAVDIVLDKKADKSKLYIECDRFGLRVLDEKDHYHIQTKS